MYISQDAMARAQEAYDYRAEPEVDGGLTSLQDLGGVRVLVCFAEVGPEVVDIDGILLGGELIEASCFSAAQITRWEQAIAAELRSDRGVQ